MAKKAGRIAEYYINGVKFVNRLDAQGMGYEFAIIDSGDCDGAGKELGIAQLPDMELQCNYNDGNAAQLALIAATGVDTDLPLECRPNGTGSGRTKITNTCKIAGYVGPTSPKDAMQTVTIKIACTGTPVWGTQA